MKNKFLEFNGKTIVFLNKEGVYWIAIKPICEALNIDYIRQFKNLKEDKILSQLLSEQTIVAEDNKLRSMICLPEQYIYGWIFSIRSKSAELLEYKKTCYDVLYNHFHGTITGRKDLLVKRQSIDSKIANLKEELKQEDEKYRQLHELQQQRKRLSGQLNSIDNEVIDQLTLFS